MEIYADMVKLHYEYNKSNKPPPLRGTKAKPKDRYKKHIPSNLKEVEKYSDIDSMVFENNKNNELVIAMRGLDLTTPRDVMIGAEIFAEDAYQQSGSDFETSTRKRKGISLLPNKYGEILLKEQEKIDNLKKEYPNKKIVLSGHSRGGRKAIDLGEYNDLEYHAFQPAEMNRFARPLLSAGTTMAMGTIIPTNKIYGELVKTFMDRDAFEQGNMMGRAINNLFIEYYTPIEIQDKVVGSAIQSNNYQTFSGRLTEKLVVPQVMRIGAQLQSASLREPADFGAMVSKEAMETQEQIETGYNIARLEKEDKRQVSSKNSNIYKTSNDITSKGYQHTQLIKPKQYAYNMFDAALGDHSIDHFVSKEMFDSINENKPIEINEINKPIEINEIKEDVKSDSLDPLFSPQENIQPSLSIGYTVNNRELCKKYGSVYSSHCNKLLR